MGRVRVSGPENLCLAKRSMRKCNGQLSWWKGSQQAFFCPSSGEWRKNDETLETDPVVDYTACWKILP